jgi:murein endopeptidase
LLTLLLASCVTPGASLFPFSPSARSKTATASDALFASNTSSAGSRFVALADTATVTEETSALEDEDGEDGVLEEAESRVMTATLAPGAYRLRYTSDLSEQALEEIWKKSPEKLGSISIGFADEGRMINAVQFPRGDGRAWVVVSPDKTWGTTETIAYVVAAVERVKSLHPGAPPLRINQISAREGGYLRPHRSHQNGRDVDLAFYYPTEKPNQARNREKVIDVGLTWELAKSLVMLGDVQVILVDRRVQKVLREYALKNGEDAAWVGSLFDSGAASIFQHARRHRDHFHVRFFSPRAQELGRRIAPLLAQRPEHNVALVRVKQGDTLGAIAFRFRSSVSAIQKANHMKSTFLRIAQILRVPLRGPCTVCPIPPPVEVPPRRIPPRAMH